MANRFLLFSVIIAFFSCGDLSDRCIKVEKTNLCYYPDEISEENAQRVAKILSENGWNVDCKMVSTDRLLIDIEIKDHLKTTQKLEDLANLIAQGQEQPFIIAVVSGLEGKSSLTVKSSGE